MTSTGSLEGLRERNRLRVIDALRQQGTASRSDLARLTGLSRTTITTLVADLQARGPRRRAADGRAALEPAGRGRPPTLLRLDPSAGAAVGIYFGHDHMRVAAADLSSTVLAERQLELDVDQLGGGRARRGRRRSSTTCSRRRASTAADVIGVGMGMSGPDRPSSGHRRLDGDPARTGRA